MEGVLFLQIPFFLVAEYNQRRDSGDDFGEKGPAHLPAGHEYRAEDGFQIHQDVFILQGEQIPVGGIVHRQHPRYFEQFGPHGAGAAHSTDDARLHQAGDPHLNLGYQVVLLLFRLSLPFGNLKNGLKDKTDAPFQALRQASLAAFITGQAIICKSEKRVGLGTLTPR